MCLVPNVLVSNLDIRNITCPYDIFENFRCFLETLLTCLKRRKNLVAISAFVNIGLLLELVEVLIF